MATQPEGDQPWKLEIAELKTALAEVTTALKAVQPADLSEIQAALQSLTAELATLKESQPDNKAAAALVASLETKITELSATVATLSLPPKKEVVPPAPPSPPEPPEKPKRTWV